MQLADLDLNKTYTYADYYKWTFDERVELINGKIFPKPVESNTKHQRILGNIFIRVANYLDDKQLEICLSPFDVRFPIGSKNDEDILTVLQPDLCVCKPEILDERGGIGVPELVVEVLYPSNNKTDLKYKFDFYESVGVKECWIVSQVDNFLQIHRLVNNRFTAHGYLFSGDIVTTDILPGFSMDLTDIFPKEKTM